VGPIDLARGGSEPSSKRQSIVSPDDHILDEFATGASPNKSPLVT
jgi:hypothetical protein